MVINRDDPWVIQTGYRLNLQAESVNEVLSGGSLGQENLERYGAVALEMTGREDASHRTSADLCFKFERTNPETRNHAGIIPKDQSVRWGAFQDPSFARTVFGLRGLDSTEPIDCGRRTKEITRSELLELGDHFNLEACPFENRPEHVGADPWGPINKEPFGHAGVVLLYPSKEITRRQSDQVRAAGGLKKVEVGLSPVSFIKEERLLRGLIVSQPFGEVVGRREVASQFDSLL